MDQKQWLDYVAMNLRIDTLRATAHAGSGHPSSALSMAEILACVMFHSMKFKVGSPNYPNNDRIILSKGHAVPILYAAYRQLGVLDEAQLFSMRKIDSPLEGHPTPRWSYTEAATGSLGQGLAFAVGEAILAKRRNLDFSTFVVLGDGEIAEGSVWEAANLASYNKLDNLIAIVDVNAMGQTGCTELKHDTNAIRDRWAAFGWHALTVDGHNVKELVAALQELHPQKPLAIIAHTWKGHESLIEDLLGYHGKSMSLDEAEKSIQRIKALHPELAEFRPLFDMKENPYRPPAPNQLPLEFSSSQKVKVWLDLKTDPKKDDFVVGKKMATRTAYGAGLLALMKQDSNVFCLDGDVCNSTGTEPIFKALPAQSLQCFIAEQTMMSAAAGIARRGAVPFASTFAAFFSRAFDQIRMTAIGNVAIRLAGSHVGVSIGEDGPSQMGLEDIAIMRSVPNSVVLYPCDAVSTYYLVQDMYDYTGGISYMRTTRGETPILYPQDTIFRIGGLHVIRSSDSDRMCIVAAGITLHEALRAHDVLKANHKVDVSVVDLYSVKPLDRVQLLERARSAGNRILVVEDHYQHGGIYEAVCSELGSSSLVIASLAVKEVPRSGPSQALLDMVGIGADGIVRTVLDMLQAA